MNDATERDLMRLLHGELAPEQEAALRRRLEVEPELAREYRELERSWRGLELPPPSPVPLGFRERVVARSRERERVPAWARAAAAAALVAGITMGVGLTGLESELESEPETEIAWSMESPENEPGLAELYLEAIEAGSWEDDAENGS